MGCCGGYEEMDDGCCQPYGDYEGCLCHQCHRGCQPYCLCRYCRMSYHCKCMRRRGYM